MTNVPKSDIIFERSLIQRGGARVLRLRQGRAVNVEVGTPRPLFGEPMIHTARCQSDIWPKSSKIRRNGAVGEKNCGRNFTEGTAKRPELSRFCLCCIFSVLISVKLLRNAQIKNIAIYSELCYNIQGLICDEAGDCRRKAGNFRGVCPFIGRKRSTSKRGVQM